MKHFEKKLYDLYGPISFISLNQKLIERLKTIKDTSINRFATYSIITLFHSSIVYIGIVFDNSKSSSSLLKFNQYIENKKISLANNKEWKTLFSLTFDYAKPLIELRNKFHAHKESEFDINQYWELNPNESDKIPIISENCIKLFDILTQEILGYSLSFDTPENEIINQFDLIYSRYDS